jgi:hypothetical protein
VASTTASARARRDFAGVEVADDDALGVAVDDHEVEHLGVGNISTRPRPIMRESAE